MNPIWLAATRAASGVALDPDYAIYEAAMTTPPSGAWQTAVNQLFVAVKAALGVTSLSDAWDIAYFLAAETSQASRLNMVKRSHDCTAAAAPTFTASRGVTGNGTTQFLDTNYNPATQGVRYVLNSASIGVYSRTSSSSSAIREFGAIGGPSMVSMGCRNTTGNMATGVNRNGEMVAAVTNSLGLFASSRVSADDTHAYRNGSLAGSELGAGATSVPSRNMYICAWNNAGTAGAFSARQIAFIFAGRSMTSGEHAAVYTAVQAAMTAIGANV